MAPEQLIRESVKQLDHRADIWALGVILLELLNGQHQFEDKTTDPFDLLYRIMSGEPKLSRFVSAALVVYR